MEGVELANRDGPSDKNNSSIDGSRFKRTLSSFWLIISFVLTKKLETSVAFLLFSRVGGNHNLLLWFVQNANFYLTIRIANNSKCVFCLILHLYFILFSVSFSPSEIEDCSFCRELAGTGNKPTLENHLDNSSTMF